MDAKLVHTLSPDPTNAAVAAQREATQGKGKSNAPPSVLRIQEKRLDATLWKIEGDNYGGNHFLVVFFTKNSCRRSPDANERRRNKRNQNSKNTSTAWPAGDRSCGRLAASSAAVAADMPTGTQQ